MAWIGRTLWIAASQPGSRSAGSEGENMRMKTTSTWLAILATIGAQRGQSVADGGRGQGDEDYGRNHEWADLQVSRNGSSR